MEPDRRVEASERSFRVLVADDNRVAQTLARGLLARLGCDVHVVSSGPDAVATALALRFDLILMDLQMPEVDGCDAAAELRRRGCPAPIVALTASAGPGEAAACEAAGMNGVLAKPIDRGALGALVEGLRTTR